MHSRDTDSCGAGAGAGVGGGVVGATLAVWGLASELDVYRVLAPHGAVRQVVMEGPQTARVRFARRDEAVAAVSACKLMLWLVVYCFADVLGCM
jgi:hypothetical protein